VLLGARDFDPGELQAIQNCGIAVVAGSEHHDLAEGAVSALVEVAARTGEVHLHLDADAHDAAFGLANEWAEPHGVDGRGYLAAVERVLHACTVGSVSLASYDPLCDPNGRIGRSCIDLLVACAVGR
jgi:arginase family enzyme